MFNNTLTLFALTALLATSSCAAPAAEEDEATATDEAALSSGFGLPFPNGSAYVITQGPFNGFSHVPPYNQHGIDFGMPVGATVVASGAGTIRFEGWYGNEIKVVIDHGNNRCTTYAHMNATFINAGQYVRRGQVIGQSGATGNVTGPHLHWGMVNCNGWTSREIVPTDELGTSYVPGTVARSTNYLR
jgi:murein DD-endopeptidase MepM/ murein hydrolase activator NlpD